MRKLKLLLAAAVLITGGGNSAIQAQTDVTATYIKNADFSQGTPITVGVCTYAKDMADNNTTYSQLVAVDGWDIPANGDARAGGLVAFGSGVWIGGPGYTAPATNSDGDATGNILGVAGVWNGQAQYTQNATLPAGTYTLVLGVYNSKGGTSAFTKNLIGFIEDSGTEHLATTTVYSVNTWKYEFITFTLAEETAGKFSLGYQGSNVGSANAQHLFLSGIQLFDGEVDAEAYEAAKQAARKAKELAAKKEQLEGSCFMTPSADLLTNGSFDTANQGWTLSNMGYQQNQERPTRYVEKWQSSALTGKGSAIQTLTNMPAGAYVLKGTVNTNQAETGGATIKVNDTAESVSGSWTEYTVEYNLEQDGGDLTVGFYYDNLASNWIAIDGFSLTYGGEWNQYQADKEALGHKKAYDDAKAEAEAAIANEEYAVITGSERTSLQAAIDAEVANTAEAYDNAAANLATLTTAFTAAKSSYETLQTVNTLVENAENLAYAKAEKPVAYTAPESAEDAVAKASELTTALRTYYESHAKAEAVEGAVDYTTSITNAADPTNNDGWTWSGSKNNPASGEPWTDADGTSTHSYFDGGSWESSSWTTTMQQTLTLPAGKYLLTAKGRAATNTTMTLQAGEETADMPHVGNAGNVFNRGWGDASVEFETKGEAVTIKVTASTSTAHEWFSVGDFRLVQLEKNIAIDLENALNAAKAQLALIDGEEAKGAPEAIISELSSTISEYEGKTYDTEDEYTAAASVLNAATAKAKAYAAVYADIETIETNINEVLESTNVSTAEARTAYSTLVSRYNSGELTTEEVAKVKDPKTRTGWRAGSPAVSQFLLSAWDSELDDWEGLHVNTWSAASDFGETGFAVPLLEYWVGSGTLPEKTMTATVEGLEPGNYKVTAEMFVKAQAQPAGISLQVGTDAAATISGTQTGDFYYTNEATAYGMTDADGKLTIKLTVDADNNASWIGLRHLNYEQVIVNYAELNAALSAAEAVNSSISGGVNSLTAAISAAQEALNSTVQADVDAAATTLTAATTEAQAAVTARKNLKGVAMKAEALKGFLTDAYSKSTIDADIAQAQELAANADATADKANAMATALNNHFGGWQKMGIVNGTFDTGLNGELISPGTEAKPYVHAVDGWTQAFKFDATAAQGIAAAYGSAAQNGTNGTAAPATDMYGSAEGGALHLSSGWSDQARYQQEIDLPEGTYVLYYEGYNANNTTAELNSNYFGLNGLTEGDLEGSNNTFVYSDAKQFAYGEWKATAFSFTLTKSVSKAMLNVGVIGGTGGSGSTPKMWFDNVQIYQVANALTNAIAKYEAAKAEAEQALQNEDYANVTGTERTNLEEAAGTDNNVTADDYKESAANLNALTKTFTDAKGSYDALAFENERALSLGVSTPATASSADEVESLVKTLMVSEYEAVTDSYTTAIDLGQWTGSGTNTSPADFSNQHWSGEVRSYKNQNDNNGQGWNASSWSMTLNQDITLPAGEYVFKAAGRKSAGANMELVVKTVTADETAEATVLGTVSDFPVSNSARGINKAGETAFEGEDSEFANNGKGYGWQWRYVPFTLEEETTINIAINASATSVHQWVSFGDYTVQAKPTVAAALVAYQQAVAAAEQAVSTVQELHDGITGPELAALKELISNQVDDSNSIAEIEDATAALNAATAALNAAADTYKAKAELLAEVKEAAADESLVLPEIAKPLYKADMNSLYDGVNAAANSDELEAQQQSVNQLKEQGRTVEEYYVNYLAEKAAATNVMGQTDAYDAATEASQTAAGTLENAIATADATIEKCEGVGGVPEHFEGYVGIIQKYEPLVLQAAKEFIGAVTMKPKACFDISSFIKNAGLDALGGWEGNMPALNFNGGNWSNAEFYNTDFDFYQTLTDMPKGNYSLKVQAFQRPGSNAVADAAYAEGNNAVNAFIYINEGQTTIKNVMQESSEEQLFSGYMADYQLTKGTRAGQYVPNGMEGARAYFDKDFYDNEILTGVEGELKFGFKCENHADNAWTIFDNFRLYYYGNTIDMTISQDADFNVLSDVENANVTLKRSFAGNGTWNTFVVPFDLTNAELKEAFGEDTEVAVYSEESDDASQAVVNFNKSVADVPANTPVLVKTNTTQSEFTFSGKTVKQGEPVAEGRNFSLVGTYAAQTTIAEGNYFLSANKLYRSAGQTTLAGLRAYIRANDDAASGARIAGISFQDGETTGISMVGTAQQAADGTYNLSGQKLTEGKLMRKGVYVVNGKKVVVK